MKNIKNFLIISLCLSLGLFLSACSPVKSLLGLLSGKSSQGAGMADFPIPVQVASLSRQPVDESLLYLGVLKSRRSIELHPKVSSHISQIYVNSGSIVSRGQLLVSLEANDQTASFGASAADVQKAKSDLGLAESQLERYKKLFENQLISRNQLEQYQNAATVARENVRSLSQRQAAQGSQLGYYQIRAPFGGTIGDVPVKIGDFVGPDITLLTISDIHELEIYLSVPSSEAMKLRMGNEIEILDESGIAIANSKISFISPIADEDDQTVLIKGILKNPDGAFKTGQKIDVRVITGQTDAVLLPFNAVRHIGATKFIFVTKDISGFSVRPDQVIKTVKQVPVNPSDLDGDNYRILSGEIPEGTEIVVSGIEKLRDGAKVLINLNEAPNQAPDMSGQGEGL